VLEGKILHNKANSDEVSEYQSLRVRWDYELEFGVYLRQFTCTCDPIVRFDCWPIRFEASHVVPADTCVRIESNCR
jgi:hypothetical protein